MSNGRSSISVAVTNQLDAEVVVYSTMSKPVTDPPSTDPDDYYPTYTKLGTVAAKGGQATFDTKQALPRVVVARSEDEFPAKLFVGDLLGPSTQQVSVAASDLANTQQAWSFYRAYRSQPYAPAALQFNEIILDSTNAATLDSEVTKFLGANGYPGTTFGDFSMIAYWATNAPAAWPGAYYCYELPASSGGGFILPTRTVGTITFSSTGASFTAQDGGTSYPDLEFAVNALSSPSASSTNGISLTGVVRDLTWEGDPSRIEMFWVGKRDGKQLIAQPYENPALPWWIAAYNLAFATYLGVQVVMLVDMAKTVLEGATSGAKWLADNAKALYEKLRSNAEDDSAEADPDAEIGDDVDPINVDVDVDVDVDTDVVTDTDNVTDTDVDVDIDIDIDIDEDIFSVVDVDIDVDIDIDTDVVTDTDNVTDTDVDVDVDVDTEVDVQPGAIKDLLSKVGNWMMTKGFPALAKNLAIMGAMTGAQLLLQAWKQQDEKDLANMSPQESTGLGLLLNYMLNEANPVSERWNTFADYVQQQQPSVTSQEMLLAAVTMFKNSAADSAQSAWRWPKATKEALEAEMAQDTGTTAYKAYQTLASYTYEGKPLPVKVGAGVATGYLAKIA